MWEMYMSRIKAIYIFFFSSRRRHTRLTCDWSSDVCSSDLLNLYRDEHDSVAPHSDKTANLVRGEPIAIVSLGARSEERRVGKESRCPGPQMQHRKSRKCT